MKRYMYNQKYIFDHDEIKYYYMNNNKDNLIIFFHGAISKDEKSQSGYTPLPVFRGYNYNNKKYDVLCI